MRTYFVSMDLTYGSQGHPSCEGLLGGVVWQSLKKTGAANRIRTCDPIITNDVLYRLSYCGTFSMGADPRLALPGGAKDGA